jgi:hypothetical protein
VCVCVCMFLCINLINYSLNEFIINFFIYIINLLKKNFIKKNYSFSLLNLNFPVDIEGDIWVIFLVT